MSFIPPTSGETPDLAGFAEAQDRKRALLGSQITFLWPAPTTYPEGTALDPLTQQPYDPTVVATSAAQPSVTVTGDVFFKAVNRGGAANAEKASAVGHLEATRCFVTLAYADGQTVYGIGPKTPPAASGAATEFIFHGARFKTYSIKDDEIVDGYVRTLVYGAAIGSDSPAISVGGPIVTGSGGGGNATQVCLALDGSNQMKSDINVGGFNVLNIAQASASGQAVEYRQWVTANASAFAALATEQARAEAAEEEIDTVINALGTTYLALNGSNEMLADLNVGSNQLVNLVPATADGQAVEYAQWLAENVTLSNAITAEVSRAEAAESAETTRAEAAEAGLSTAISNETTRAEAAESGLSTSIAAETTRAESAESTLSTSIADEVTRAEAAEALLAPIASPVLTGVPQAPTATAGTSTTQIATTAFVAATVGAASLGLQSKGSAQYATAGPLPTNTYSSGILTASSNGALSVDSASPSADDLVLVKNEASQPHNGLYVVTNAGSVSAPWVLTRAPSMSTDAEIPGAFVFIESGSVNALTGWMVANAGPFALGTTAIAWAQLFGPGDLVEGAGISISGNTIAANIETNVAELQPDGTASIGGSGNFVWSDHVHPTDTTRAPLASPALTGTPTTPDATALSDNEQVANTKYVDSAVAVETSRAEAAEASNASAISAETTRAEAAESGLSTSISNEVTRAEGAESSLSTAISNETTRAETEESTLSSAISAETTRAEAAEATNATAISNETTRAEAAESTLTTAISTETTRAEGAESTLSTAISAETTRAEAAEASLAASISAAIGIAVALS